MTIFRLKLELSRQTNDLGGCKKRIPARRLNGFTNLWLQLPFPASIFSSYFINNSFPKVSLIAVSAEYLGPNNRQTIFEKASAFAFHDDPSVYTSFFQMGTVAFN